MLASLAAFVKGQNFPGKRRYIVQAKGLDQLTRWITRRGKTEKELYGDDSQLRKIKIKLLQILNDLTNNDDSIINDGSYVREFIANDHYLQERLLDIIKTADLSVGQDVALRQAVSTILFRVYQRCQDLKPLYEEVYQAHADKLQAFLE